MIYSGCIHSNPWSSRFPVVNVKLQKNKRKKIKKLVRGKEGVYILYLFLFSFLSFLFLFFDSVKLCSTKAVGQTMNME